MSQLKNLAHACWTGACNPHGIIRSLGEAIGEVPPGQARQCIELKIIIGQLSFLLGESLGPSEEACSKYRQGLGKEGI